MEEKEILEARKFLALIADPRIRAFIDIKKISLSAQYRVAVDAGAAHAQKHGDFSILDRVMALVDGTPHAAELVAYLRPKLNFVIAPTTPKTFKKTKPELVAKAAMSGASAPVAHRKIRTPAAPKKKAVKKKRKYDLLDSYLRLPGSFGSGKHR
jgi:hypothetical protein